MNLFLKVYPILSALHWYTSFASGISFIGYIVIALVFFALGFLYNYTGLSQRWPGLKYGPKMAQAISFYPTVMKYLEKDQIVNHGQYLEITAKYYGDNTVIRVPYSSQLRRKMQGLKVFLFKSDMKIDITNHPGIPYFLTANQMGGSKIQFIRGQEVIKTFGSQAIPKI